MKNIFTTVLFITYSILVCSTSYGQESIQKVEPFLPDIFSQFPNVRDIAISPDENEIYFTAQSYMGELSAIVSIRLENGKYTKPEVVSFSGQYHDLEPSFSPDGLRLFFSSNRPASNSTNEVKDYDIWFVERKIPYGPWSDPINVGYPVNTKENEFYPSISRSNNLYFTSDGPNSKGKDDIFISKFQQGKFVTPISLPDSINSDGIEFNGYISPDESFLLYSGYNRENGLGSGDLYISYNKGNDQWTTSKNLGLVINSAKMDYCPFANAKSGVLYFTSKRNSVNAQSTKKQNTSELLHEMNRYENGLSRIYQIKINAILP